MIKETLKKQKKIRCSDTKGYSVIRNKAIALQKPYIQANPLNSFEWIIVDIDHQNTYLEDLPVKPNIIVYNKDNRKAHYYFKIKAVHNNGFSSFKALEYYQAVRYGLNILLDGDIAFTQTLSKNPLAKEHFRVLEVHNKEYELAKLADYCDLVPRYKIKAITDIREKAEIIGRNQTIFDTVRVEAFEAYKINALTEEQIRAIADSYNNNLVNPLPKQEVKHIAKSISKYIDRPKNKIDYQKFIEKQSERGKRSGIIRQAMAQKNKDIAFIYFSNKNLTLEVIANKLNLSIRQIKRYKAEYKKVTLTISGSPPVVLGSFNLDTIVNTKEKKIEKKQTIRVGYPHSSIYDYLSDNYSLYSEDETTEKIPINTINRLIYNS